MARTLAQIDAEIAVLESFLSSAASTVSTAGSRGTNIGRIDIAKAQTRLDVLYIQRDRLSGAAPMFTPARITGLRTR